MESRLPATSLTRTANTAAPRSAALPQRSAIALMALMARVVRLARVVPLVLALLASWGVASPLAAHEVPARVTVQLLAKAESRRLRLAVRVPLESLRDLDLPLLNGEYVDIARLTPQLRDAATLWIAGYLELYEGDQRLGAPTIVATRVSLPSDRSFESFDGAVANTSTPPLPQDVGLPWRQAMVDLVLDYAIASPASHFSMRPLLAHLGVTTTTVLRWVAPDGGVRGYEYQGNPGLVRLDPSAWQAAAQFVRLGFAHILGGLDHLLFLLCLVIPFRRLRPLVAVVTAFTAAHSVTLIASALGMAPRANWFPPLIEVLIALSIVLMAIGNILGPRLEKRWIVAFGFGLIHGFGFSFALGESLQFAGRHLLASLLAFNVGVELGQLLVIALAVPAIAWLLRRLPSERTAVIVASAIVAHEAWHWMTERWGVLRAYHVTWPAFDLALAATLLRSLMLLLLIVAVLWGVATVVSRLVKSPSQTAGWTAALLAALLLTGAPNGAAAQGEVRSTLKGVYTEAQAARGKDIYVGTCRECHTPASHTGVVFKNSWGGKFIADLLAFMMEKMPKNNPGSLSPEEYADVTAYILSLNGLPAGDNELPSDQAAARRIRIETTGR